MVVIVTPLWVPIITLKDALTAINAQLGTEVRMENLVSQKDQYVHHAHNSQTHQADLAKTVHQDSFQIQLILLVSNHSHAQEIQLEEDH